jgi:hypothetical protein
MELLSVLGQYLLLSFVLPGFCYVAVLLLWLPKHLYDDVKKYWLATGIISGLLLSSVAFAIEMVARYLSATIDCQWFPRIAFDQIHDMGSVVNFFAGETFMHLNIALGFLVILIVFLIAWACGGVESSPTTNRAERKFSNLELSLVAIALVVVVAANLVVSSTLFHRVDDIAFNVRDEVGAPRGYGSAKYCTCQREHPADDKACKAFEPAPDVASPAG